MLRSTSESTKRHGRHYTPTELARFLAIRSTEYLRPGIKLRVLDPACGDGELLLAAANILTMHNFEITELVGLDLDSDAIKQASRRLARLDIPVSLSVTDFLGALDDGTNLGHFDFVITNPPYVRTQVLGANISRQLAARFQLKGRVDLTHAFIAITTQLLAPDGIIALLCSNRFLSTKAGANVRKILIKNYQLHRIYDLGDTKLFEAAVLPAVVIAERRNGESETKTPSQFIRVYEAPDTEAPARTVTSVLDALCNGDGGMLSVGRKKYAVQTGKLIATDPNEPWQLNDDSSEWISRVVASAWKTFGDIARIRVGIKTTADSVFIRENWDELPAEHRPESSLLIPLITHHDTFAWKAEAAGRTRVLYPYDLSQYRRKVLSLAEYPRTLSYLKLYEERLRSRRYVIEGGREWYEIWVPQRPSKWAEPKIVFPDISETPQFALDHSCAIVNGDCYWISCADLPSLDLGYLMLAVANSSFGVRFYDTVCGNKLYSGKRRWITQYVERMPLPNPDTSEARRAIALARQLSGADSQIDRDAILPELDHVVETAFAKSWCNEEVPRKPDLQLSILDVAFKASEL
jgi:adenine-specific DNA-methyltransferase